MSPEKQHREANEVKVSFGNAQQILETHESSETGMHEDTMDVGEDKGCSVSSKQPDRTWDSYFDDLKQYKEKHGNCLVSSRTELGKWATNQMREYKYRIQKRRSSMTNKRIEELEALGFDWHGKYVRSRKRLRQWYANVESLKKYKAEHGDCTVPYKYTQNPQLGKWVHNQRREYRQQCEGKPCSINSDQISLLDEIGFVWAARSVQRRETWHKFLGELMEYKDKNGDCNVPQKYQNSHSLGEWVRRQRDRYKTRIGGLSSTMSDTEIEELEAIGFRWESKMQLIREGQSRQTSKTNKNHNLDNQVSHFRFFL
eukprot:scaffold36096_cov59-Attheya_sp.AAC.4